MESARHRQNTIKKCKQPATHAFSFGGGSCGNDGLLAHTFFKKHTLPHGSLVGRFFSVENAARIPQKPEACFAISPMIAQMESDRLLLKWRIAQAAAANQSDALLELSKVTIPFENVEQIFLHRYWLALFTGNKPVQRSFVHQWANRWLRAFNDSSFVVLKQLPRFYCPVHLFVGDKDYQTHYSLAQSYFYLLKAEKNSSFGLKIQGIILILQHQSARSNCLLT